MQSNYYIHSVSRDENIFENHWTNKRLKLGSDQFQSRIELWLIRQNKHFFYGKSRGSLLNYKA